MKTAEAGSLSKSKVGRLSQGWPSKEELRATGIREENWTSKEVGG